LIASQIGSLGKAPADADSFATSWSKCMAILQHYRERVQSSNKAISVLEDLRRRVYPCLPQSSIPCLNSMFKSAIVNLTVSSKQPRAPVSTN
jgi:hypothetical protein